MRKLLVGSLVTAAMFSLSAQELEVNVGSGTASYTPDQLELINGGTVTEIRKTGAGTLLSSGISGFDGIIRICGGVLKVSDATGLGTADGATVVESGATLHFDSLSTGYTTYKSERYEIAGDGCNASPAETNGAIRITGATCQLSHLKLTADASIRSEKGFHFYDDGDSTIDMGGRTLRMYSASSGNLDVEWRLDGIVNPGHVEIHDARYFRPAGSPFAGGGDHEIRLFGRAGLLLESTAEKKTWAIVRYGTGGFYQTGNNGCWDGPLENRNPAYAMSMSVGAGKTLVLNGPLVGAGGFLKDANLGTVVLNGENIFTSVFEAKGGTLVLGSRASAAGSIVERFKFSNLTVSLGLTGRSESWPKGWTDEEFAEAAESCRASAIKNLSVSLHAASGDTVDRPMTFSGDWSAIMLGAVPGGETRYIARFSDSPDMRFYTLLPLRITRPEGADGCGALGKTTVEKGEVFFDDAGIVDIGAKSLNLGVNNSTEIAGLRVGKSTVLTSASGSSIGLPNSADCKGVWLDVEEGAAVTNRFQFSIGSTASSGALYVSGGEAVAPYTASAIGYLGGRGQGYISVSDGSFTTPGYLHLGTFASGSGQISVSGGGFSVANTYLYVGEAGSGVVHHSGGEVSLKSLILCSSAFESDKSGSFGVYTISGAAAVTDIEEDVVLNNRIDGTAVLNLNGGVFKASSLVKSASAGEAARAYVNFDGGVFKAGADNAGLFENVDAVTVYGGGATIDTDGHDVALGKPLSSPREGAFASIAVDVSVFADIVCPPHIAIEGDGEGASAVAMFDSASRKVTGIVVTSPGWGYTAEKTKVSAVYRGKPGIVAECTFTLTGEYAGAPVKLTKRGEGKLTLGEGVLPAGTTLSVEGGSVGGAGLSFSEYSVTPGVSPCGTLDFWPEGAVLSVGNLSGLDKTKRYVLLAFADSGNAVVPPLAEGCALPEGWCLKTLGRKLMLTHPRVFSMILK